MKSRIDRALRAIGSDLRDFLLAHACPGCGRAAPRDGVVCGACDARVSRTGEVLCLRCLRDGDRGGPDRSPAAAGRGCPEHGSGRLLLAGPAYEPPLDRILHAFKYSGARQAYRWIASLLPEPPGRGGAAWREYLLVAVPLHPARRAWRGFDQAKLLAETAGGSWGIPVATALERRRDHPPQAQTDAEARRDNVRDAFTLVSTARPLVRGRAILLVDDVATTGSTLLEAAAALETAEPSWILALTAAHGGLPAGSEPLSAARIAALHRV